MSFLGKHRKQTLINFCEFCYKELSLKKYPSIVIKNNKDGLKTFANFSFDKNSGFKPIIMVYGKNRLLADIMRSLAHELVHYKQYEDRELDGEIKDVGGDIENEANAKAGELVKKYGYINRKIYEE
jgi:hypothetical protein